MNNVKLFLSGLSLSLAAMAGAQAPVVSFRLAGAPEGAVMDLNIRPLDNEDFNSAVTLKPDADGLYKGAIVGSAADLYSLYCLNPELEFQTSTPIYIPQSYIDGPVINLSLDGYTLTSGIDDAANRDLVTCNKAFMNLARTMPKWSLNENSQVILDHLRSYMAIADSVLSANPAPELVGQYIRLWGYTAASDAYRMVVHMRGMKNMEVPFGTADFLPEPRTVLNAPLAASFTSTTLNVANTLKGTLADKMDQLYADYTVPEIRRKVSTYLLENYLSRFNYAKDAEAGEKMLADVTAKYDMGDQWVKQFNARKCTVPGAPFPADVKLVDARGNSVDFAKFRGKWVYVDLWASWCGPCVREVPFLQNLEKELEGGNVEFVSISTDTSSESWHKKMAQLSMHGNQLLDSDGNLCKQLNVTGIPHFLIYNPEGKLAVYKATRPSDPATLTTLKDLP